MKAEMFLLKSMFMMSATAIVIGLGSFLFGGP